jgi:hypothetical protein
VIFSPSFVCSRVRTKSTNQQTQEHQEDDQHDPSGSSTPDYVIDEVEKALEQLTWSYWVAGLLVQGAAWRDTTLTQPPSNQQPAREDAQRNLSGE